MLQLDAACQLFRGIVSRVRSMRHSRAALSSLCAAWRHIRGWVVPVLYSLYRIGAKMCNLVGSATSEGHPRGRPSAVLLTTINSVPGTVPACDSRVGASRCQALRLIRASSAIGRRGRRGPRWKGITVVSIRLASITDVIQRCFICSSSCSCYPPIMAVFSGRSLTPRDEFPRIFPRHGALSGSGVTAGQVPDFPCLLSRISGQSDMPARIVSAECGTHVPLYATRPPQRMPDGHSRMAEISRP